MPTPGASTSCTSAGVQEDVSSLHLLLPIADGHGCTAPPPTPIMVAAPSLPCSLPAQYDGSLSLDPPAPSNSKSAVDHGILKSDSLASPPSKEDLDALARFLMQQSLHATPHLLASPPIRRKRPSAAVKTQAAIQAENDITSGIIVEKVTDAGSKLGHHINLGEEEQVTYSSSYCGGFSDESKRRIGKACREVGAFYIHVLDAGSALRMVQETCGADDASVVEGGRVPISEVLTSTSQQHQHDALDLNMLAMDAAADTNFRMLANSLWTISKDLLRLLLQGLPDESQAHMKGDILKPLAFKHGSVTQHWSLTDTVISLTSRDDNSREDNIENALFLVAIGPQLQTWSQGEYKSPLLKTSRDCGAGAIGIHFVLVQDR